MNDAQTSEREANPLECLHINQGSADAAADAYERAHLIEKLQRFEDPERGTQAEWERLDWRTFCGVLWRSLAGITASSGASQAARWREVAELIEAERRSYDECGEADRDNAIDCLARLERRIEKAAEAAPAADRASNGSRP